MREVTRITMLRILFVQDLKINVKFMNLLSIIFLIIEFVAITFFIPSKKDNIIFLTNTEKKEKKKL